LQLIASRLSGYPPDVRGPGLVYRIAAEAQRDFFDQDRSQLVASTGARSRFVRAAGAEARAGKKQPRR
jgi:hypothetical protein